MKKTAPFPFPDSEARVYEPVVSTIPPESGEVRRNSDVRIKILNDPEIQVVAEKVRYDIICLFHNINQPLAAIAVNIHYMMDYAPEGTFQKCIDTITHISEGHHILGLEDRKEQSDSWLNTVQEHSIVMNHRSLDLPHFLMEAHKKMYIKNPEGVFDETIEAIDRLSIDILRFSSLCFQGYQEMDPIHFDAVEMLESLVRGSRLGDIIVEVPETSPSVFADKRQIEQVIENILSNAYKYGHRASIAITTINNVVRIDIRDNGPGIPTNEDTLFTIFQRGKTAPQRAKGHGIGLAFCKKTIEAAGGTISASNIYNEETSRIEGACFSVELPITEGLLEDEM